MINLYDSILEKTFDINNFYTIKDLKLSQRVSFKNDIPYLLLNESLDLIKKLFGSYDIYVRITFWDKSDVNKIDFKDIISSSIFKDHIIFIVKLKIEDEALKHLLLYHLNYEIGLDPAININAFFFNLDLKTLLNIYDDRGADYVIIR